MKNNLFNKFPYIVAWGKKWGSDQSFVESECEKANKDNAPSNAFYKKEDGTWAVAEEKIKEELDLYINGTKGGIFLRN